MLDQNQLNDRLVKAAQEGDLSALGQALEDGADARVDESQALFWAAMRGHVECVRRLIPVSDPKAHNYQALRWAVYEGHADCVALLLPAGELWAQESDVKNAVGLVRASGHVEVAGMIEAFIEAKALSGCAQKANMKPRAKSAL